MPTPEQAADLLKALDHVRNRLDRYRLYRSYYSGDQRLVYSSEKFWNTFGKLFTELADNLCVGVCDAVADRLEVTGFAVRRSEQERRTREQLELQKAELQRAQRQQLPPPPPQPAPQMPQMPPVGARQPTVTVGNSNSANSQQPAAVSQQQPRPDPEAERLQAQLDRLTAADERLQDLAWEIWQQNQMDLRAGEVHLEALREGDSYVIVWPGDDGQAVVYPQRADQTMVVYSDDVPGRIEWGAKVWLEPDKRCAVTLYYQDRIEKWVTDRPTPGVIPDKTDGFVPREQTGDGGWPLRNPYDRPPIFHFPNNSAIGTFGVSELRSVIPVQDALNFSIASMLVAMEYVALPQRYACGIEVETDPVTGRPKNVPFVPGVDRVWTVGDPDVRFGEFQPASMDGFLKVQDSFRNEIASISGTPKHYLGLVPGGWPSGEAQKVAEQRFLARCNDRMTVYGAVWEQVVAFALKVQDKLADVQMKAEWEDPAPRSEKEHIDTLAVKHRQLGVPLQQVWREAGYTGAEIEQMLVDKEDDRMSSMFGANLLEFNAGR